MQNQVSAYALKNYDPSPADEITGFASNMGVVKTAGTTVVCFSRPLAGAAANSDLTSAGVCVVRVCFVLCVCVRGACVQDRWQDGGLLQLPARGGSGKV